ncbi:Hypothetical predicted protein, partial [Paramuricea clavata]
AVVGDCPNPGGRDHWIDVASSGIVIEDKSSSSTLNHLGLVDVPLGVSDPDCRNILKLWTDKTGIRS